MRNVGLALIVVLITASAPAEEGRRVIKVSARSQVLVDPDEVFLAFSLAHVDQQLLAAKRASDETAILIAEIARKHALGPEELKVENLDIGPRYGERRTLLGYGVTRSLEVRLSDFEKIEPVIAELVETAGDHISIDRLNFQVKDQRKHQFEARRLAVEYAREKASHLAELNGMKLGDPISIVEDIEYNEDGGGFGGFGGGYGAGLEPREGRAVAASPSIPTLADLLTRPVAQETEKEDAGAEAAKRLLAPGQVSLNASVEIQFELLPAK